MQCASSGVGVFEGVRVDGVDVEGGRVTGVRTDKGRINCEVFINCAGQVSHYVPYYYIHSKKFLSWGPIIAVFEDDQ